MDHVRQASQLLELAAPEAIDLADTPFPTGFIVTARRNRDSGNITPSIVSHYANFIRVRLTYAYM